MVLPHLTESYGDSADPPEAATPVCTLKSFPYKIEHTIQWARELFDEQFRITPQNVGSFSPSICPYLCSSVGVNNANSPRKYRVVERSMVERTVGRTDSPSRLYLV